MAGLPAAWRSEKVSRPRAVFPQISSLAESIGRTFDHPGTPLPAISPPANWHES